MQVLEVGIGSFPNALYLGSQQAPQNMDIIGVDPNETWHGLKNLKICGFLMVYTWHGLNNLWFLDGLFNGRSSGSDSMEVRQYHIMFL